MSPTEIIVLFSVAALAGVMNSIAGGGSFIVLPTLIFMGLPPVNANATGTIALWPGTLASTGAYRRSLNAALLKSVAPLIVVTFLGSVVGAVLLLRTPQLRFMKMIPWLLLVATVLFSFGGRTAAWVNRRHATHGPSPVVVAGVSLLQFCAGIYIGYFGAGVGFLILALLSMVGIENIHSMNGIRLLLVTCGNAVAIFLFVAARAVAWPQAATMVIGAALGGYAGAHYVQKVKPSVVRAMVIALGCGMTAYFFWRTRGM